MNIKHVKLPDNFIEEMGDKLEFLIKTQKSHEVAYSAIEVEHGHQVPDFPIDIHNRHDQQFFKDGVFRMLEELCEATNCLRNRPHSQTEYQTDEEHFLEEFSDGLHYFLRLVVMLGLDADDLVKIYFKKSQVNEFRRASNY